MDADIITVAAALIAVLIALVSAIVAHRANDLPREANRYGGMVAEEARKANTTAMQALDESRKANQIAEKANAIALEAFERQDRSDALQHGAHLVLLPELAGIDDQQPSGRFIKAPLHNLGPADAINVRMQLRRMGAARQYSEAGPHNIAAGKRSDFLLRVSEDLFTPSDDGPIVDYRVTHKDRLTHHEKWFRLQLQGHWDTDWTLKLLAIKLDGKRASFEGAQTLADGVDFEYDE